MPYLTTEVLIATDAERLEGERGSCVSRMKYQGPPTRPRPVGYHLSSFLSLFSHRKGNSLTGTSMCVVKGKSWESVLSQCPDVSRRPLPLQSSEDPSS